MFKFHLFPEMDNESHGMLYNLKLKLIKLKESL